MFKSKLTKDTISIQDKVEEYLIPFAFVLSPVLKLLKGGSQKLVDNTENRQKTNFVGKSVEYADIESQESKKSANTEKCETEFIDALVEKIQVQLTQHHKDFNPIAQTSPFYIQKNPSTFQLGDF